MVPPAGSPATLMVTSTEPGKLPPSETGEKVGVASATRGGASIPASMPGGATSGGPASGGPASGGVTGTSTLTSMPTLPPPAPSLLPPSVLPVVVFGGGGVVLSSPPHPATMRVHNTKNSRPNHVPRFVNAARQPPTSPLAIALICSIPSMAKVETNRTSNLGAPTPN